MDKETKNILKILGVAIVVLYIFKPRKSKIGKRKLKNQTENKGKSATEPPKAEGQIEKEFQNAIISIKAVRKAINNSESKSEIEKLNRMTLKEYGIKVFKNEKSGKLVARNTKGEDVAKEE
jgi:hypothetical protein